MADTTKTYVLTCPDPGCLEEFEIQLAPEALTEDGDLIQCPACMEKWVWEYDDESDSLDLVNDFEDEIEDEDEGFDDEEDDEGEASDDEA